MSHEPARRAGRGRHHPDLADADPHILRPVADRVRPSTSRAARLPTNARIPGAYRSTFSTTAAGVEVRRARGCCPTPRRAWPRRSGRCHNAAGPGTPAAAARAASARSRAAPTRSGSPGPRRAHPPARRPSPAAVPQKTIRRPASRTSGRTCRRSVLPARRALESTIVSLPLWHSCPPPGHSGSSSIRSFLLLRRTRLTRSHPDSLSRRSAVTLVAAEAAVDQLAHAVRGVDRVASAAASMRLRPGPPTNRSCPLPPDR